MDQLTNLAALRAFSMVARLGSFAAAARDMGVTASALSQQVRNLEISLGKSLFQRLGNRIIPTEAGQALYPNLEHHFSEIARCTNDLRAAKMPARLIISASPSFAELWLYGRLQSCPLRDIDVRAELDPVDLAGNDIDIRVTYGTGLYPEHHCVPLFSDHFIAIARPDVAARAGPALDGINDDNFVHTVWGPEYANVPSWQAWMRHAGLPRIPNLARGVHVRLTAHSIAAAAEGLGIALAPRTLAQPALKAGNVVIVNPTQMPMDSAYCAYIRHARTRRDAVVTVLNALIS